MVGIICNMVNEIRNNQRKGGVNRTPSLVIRRPPPPGPSRKPHGN